MSRLSPDARREALIEAVLRCLRRDGREGLSTRRIGAEAGISLGLINHYFPQKDALVAAAYETMADRLLETFTASALAAPPGPARLRAFVEAFFDPASLDPSLLRAWIVFWAAALESGAVRAAHDAGNGRFRDRLASLLAEARALPANRIDAAAIELGALLDGLWLEWCLSARPFEPDVGRAICRRWIDRYLEQA